MKRLFRHTIFINIALLLFAVLTGCTQVNVFEKNTPIPGSKWSRNFPATGSFEITDTSSFYNIFIVLRHTDSYNYNNIWLNIGVMSPGDSMRYQKMDLALGNDREGWEGTGMNDIWEVRKLIFGQPRRFARPGTYKFSINHIMRNDPLPHIMSAGMRIEKAP
ncbi:MAG: gliding motility lipoprotein GldH [Chitinophagaceae bacterium]|nr:MAG: gliding motility lipoprotein GldH [Chitinophagaceae bacterium]